MENLKYNCLGEGYFFRRVKVILQNKGLFYLIKKTFYKYIFPIYLMFRKKQNFMFQERKYDYFYHAYNIAWANERTVEVPIIKRKVELYRGKEILEVGNVLSHHLPVHWDIVDKYERVNDIINEDVISFRPKKRYDLIISISTLEHVGWDETPRDPKKILTAIKNLKDNCLKSDGELVVTLPINYNPIMDQLLFSGKLEFDEIYCLKRLGWDNRWKQVTLKEVMSARFDSPFIGAHGLVLGVIKK